jgi:ribosomal protein S12 methylthiotransferase accessory factor
MPIQVYFDGPKQVNALIDDHTLFTDQPVSAGGGNSAPTPFDTFLGSLATCAGIYVKGFCDQRGIDSSSITLDLDYQYDPIKKMIGKIIIRINVPAGFPEQYDEAVIRSAALCAVKRHLHPDIENDITVVRR